MDELTDADLVARGIYRAPTPPDVDWSRWAKELSKPTLDSLTFEGDGEYAFYRNIMDEPEFPFGLVIQDIAPIVRRYFGVEAMELLRLDDAFCVHYNETQEDSSGAKHMDPSDITVNMCIERSPNVKGSEVKFYGHRALHGSNRDSTDGEFLLVQKQGFLTVHWGDHPHETLALTSGRRTNIVLTFVFKDKSRSSANGRNCYF